jgi:hypothetical protein
MKGNENYAQAKQRFFTHFQNVRRRRRGEKNFLRKVARRETIKNF